MKKFVGMFLILVALTAGYLGIQQLNNSGGTVKFLGMKISAEDSSAKQKGYIYLGLAVVALVGGVALIRKE